MFRENPDFIGVFCCPNAGFSRCIFEDVKPLFSLWVQYRTPVQLNIRRRRTSQNLSAVLHFPSPKFCKRLRAFSISRKRSDQNVLHQHTSPQQYGGHHEATTRWKSAGRRQAPWGVYASRQYDELDVGERITMEMSAALLDTGLLSSYSTELVKAIVTAITLHADKGVTLTLKNGQQVRKERSDGAHEHSA